MALVARVLIDEPGLDREFSYLVPDEMLDGGLPIGTIVRVKLRQRPMRGWVVEVRTAEADEADELDEIEPGGGAVEASGAGGYRLIPISGVVGAGPPLNVVELAGWAAQRWAGTRVHFLRAASPKRVVKLGSIGSVGLADSVCSPGDAPGGNAASVRKPNGAAGGSLDSLLSGDFATNPPELIQTSPGADEMEVVQRALVVAERVAAERTLASGRTTSNSVPGGRTLILTPTLVAAHRLAHKITAHLNITQAAPSQLNFTQAESSPPELRGASVALAPEQWEQSASAQVVIGARGAAWAPLGRVDAVVVFDEHDQAYESEAAPSWNARTVALQRAHLDDAACFLVSPIPSPEAIKFTNTSSSPTPAWPTIEIIDRRGDDPYSGEWCSDRLARILADAKTLQPSPARAVCVLNRKGRARLAICKDCGTLARNETTGAAFQVVDDQFVDPTSGEARPLVCEGCGALKFRRARLGVKGVAAELEALVRQPVKQITAEQGRSRDDFAGQPGGYFIGTEAVLRRIERSDIVAFLDFDQELAAPRYRAEEEAMALIALAARMVSGAAARVVIQTRQPDHPVLAAAASGELRAWAERLLELRTKLRQPPATSWALISGAAAEEYVERLRAFAVELPADPAGGSGAGPGGAALEISASSPGKASPNKSTSAKSSSAKPSGAAKQVWRVRSDDPAVLHAALTQVERPRGRLRVAVDPARA